MKKTLWVKVLGILGILILLFMSSYWPLPARAADISGTSGNKISSLLSLHIKMKQAQPAFSSQKTVKSFGVEPESTGETTLLDRERVFLHFAQPPKPDQVNELNSLGVTVYPDSWIPPVNNFKTGFVLADMPVDKLDSLTTKSYIVSLDTAEQILSPLNDQARAAMNVDPVWNVGDTGAGVTVAVLDSGLDTSNADFPSPIAAVDYSKYPVIDNTVVNTVIGHGTHVTGSLLGRGVHSATYKGVAPGASLVFIKVGNDTDGSASSDAVTYAIRDAVDIYHAKIINLSIGSWSEYHDGSDQTCQTIDYATSRGTAVFVAAGNYANKGWHYSDSVNSNSTTNDIPIILASGSTSYLATNLVWYDGWYDGLNTQNSLSLQYYDSYHNLLAPARSGQSESPRGAESDQYSLNTPVNAGTYYLRVQNTSSNNQSFHIYYMGGLTAVTFSNSDPNYTIASPAEADSSIAVGAYVTRDNWTNYKGSTYRYAPSESVGSIATFSSRGPRIDTGAPPKPDIVAPGSAVISVRDPIYALGNTNYDPGIIKDSGSNNGNQPANYYVMEGTSMASPVAAGGGALIVNKNPSFTPAQLKQALEVTATDKGTAGWDNIYGFGLINAGMAVNVNAAPGKIVFTSNQDNGTRIYTMNGDGSNQTRLTNDNYTSPDPVFSPDGNKIAFVGPSINGNGMGLCVMNSDGTGLQKLTNACLGGGGISWSPDGSSIVFSAFINSHVQVFSVNTDGSNQQQLTDGSFDNTHPGWSSDGSKIAFISNREGRTNEQIYVMNTNGSNQTKITNGSNTQFYSLSWEPGGNRILFDTFTYDSPWISKGICIINSNGTGRTQLPLTGALQSAAWPVWSPDGTKIAFQSPAGNPSSIYTANIDGTNISRLTYTFDQQPSWGRGQWNALSVSTGEATYLNSNSTRINGSINSFNSPSSVRVSFQVGTNSGSYTIETAPQTITSSGPFTANLTGLSPGSIYYFRAKAYGEGIGYGVEKTFAFGTASPVAQTNSADNVTTNFAKVNGRLVSLGAAVSVNGSFEYGTTTNYGSHTPNQLLNGTGPFSASVANLLPHTLYHYRMKADAGVTGNSTGIDMTFITPPDITGSRIAYNFYINNNYEIYAMNSDGTSQTRLTNNTTDDLLPTFSPDGARIAFISKRNGNQEIYVMNADGSNQTRLTNNIALDNSNVKWSPDGTKIAYNSGPAGVGGGGSTGIYVMNADGSQQTKLTNYSSGTRGPSWSPDGAKIAFTNNVSGIDQIFVMSSSDGSNKTQITQQTAYSANADNPVWSPDGTKILFEWSRDDYTPSLYVTELFTVNADGSNPVCVGYDPDNITGGSWSPDGTKIAYFTQGNGGAVTTIVYADGSGMIWQIKDFNNPVWSPDSKRLLLQAMNGMFAIDTDKSNLAQLATGYTSIPVSWAPGHWPANSTVNAPSVTTYPASNPTANSISLNGYLTNKGSANSVLVSFDWGTDTGYNGGNITPVLQIMSAPGNFSADLTGLSPSTIYHYRAKAIGDGIATGDDMTFTTKYAPIGKLIFTSPPQSITAGSVSGNITLQSQDFYGNPMSVSANTTVTLSSASITGKFDLTASGQFNGSVNCVIIPAGSSSAVFYYKDTRAEIVTLTADTVNLVNDTQQETIIAGSLDHYSVSVNYSSVMVTQPFSITGNARDIYDNNLVTGNETLNITFGKADAGATPTSAVLANGAVTIVMKMTVAQSNQTIIFSGSTSGKTGTSNSFDVITAPSTGGGGGGSSSYTPPPAPKIVKVHGLNADTDLNLDVFGRAQSAVQLKTDDGNVTFDIAKNTALSDVNGAPLTSLSVSVLATPPTPPLQNVILLAYEFGPENAQFNPAITLTLPCDVKKLPEGTVSDTITVAYWDGTKWVAVDSKIDAGAGIITSQINHFSQWALMAKVIPPAKFSISDLKLSTDKVAPGDMVTIRTTVSNTGGSSGKYTVVLKVNGETISSQDVTLDPGGSQAVSFGVTKSIPGSYNFDLNGRTGQFTINWPEKTPEISPLAALAVTSTPAPAAPASPSAATDATATKPAPDKGSGFSWVWPIIGMAAIGLVVVVISVVWQRRGQKP